MRRFSLVLLFFELIFQGVGQQVIVSYDLPQPAIVNHRGYQLAQADGMMQSALAGEPALPWQQVSVLLPPGCEAADIEVSLSNPVSIQGTVSLFPYQYSSPLSKDTPGPFVKNESLYASKAIYPSSVKGRASTHFFNGYAVAFTAFTPVSYVPATGKMTWYTHADVVVTLKSSEKATQALRLYSSSASTLLILRNLVRNPENIALYSNYETKADPLGLLIITPAGYQDGFNDLRSYYSSLGISSEVVSPEDIYNSQTGVDNQEKIRNYIISRVQNGGVNYVLLGGDVELVPARGFYCQVNSQGNIYEDSTIPADLYYSALDGTWDENGNGLWGEPDEDDLLPDIAVARLPYSTLTDEANMLHKVLSYQENPVGNELTNTLMAGEDLYSNPQTWGGDYLDLLIGHSEENGYSTDGIPESFPVQKMYDRDLGYWSKQQLLDKINSGMTFIHHSGHSNVDYAMRMSNGDVTDANFSGVNGVDHNYCIVYTHGCICGAFDADDCIAEEMLKIQNFAVAGGFNSRYGWFNEGTTEGPSEHLHREFVNALYTLDIKRIGLTQVQSKVATAPWVEAPGQWEEGALRWCFYDNNILGDAAMEIHTDNFVPTSELAGEFSARVYPNPASDYIDVSVPETSGGLTTVTLFDLSGKMVTNIHSGSSKTTIFGIRMQVCNLPEGTYILKAETPTAVFSSILSVVR